MFLSDVSIKTVLERISMRTIFNKTKSLFEKVSDRYLHSKKKVLMMGSFRIKVVGNPHFPRQSAFEIELKDGTVLWTKLNHPSGDGRNNYPHVFPTNEQLLEALDKHLGLKYTEVIPSSKLSEEEETQRGIW